MKLKEYRVREFRSVWDSGPIEVDDRKTCLVGKNEAGKTALLTALYRTNPLIASDAVFDLDYDYPKREIMSYESAVSNNEREPVTVVRCTYQLESQEIEAIQGTFGDRVLKSNDLETFTYYGEHCRKLSIKTDESIAIKNLAEKSDFPPALSAKLNRSKDWEEALNALEDEQKIDAVTESIRLVQQVIELGFDEYICQSIIAPLMPKFLYFDNYYRMNGRENLNALIQRDDTGSLRNSDRPLIGLIKLARLDLRDLRDVVSTEKLKNKLENASNHLTSKIMRYWSQNKHILVRFDVRDGKPGDPEGMRNGVNVWADIYDRVHMASTRFDARSHGFVWFFSFLAWYEHLKLENQDLILLLDEPGLSLHGRAQEDLLRYFDEELTRHQLLYTTHSPFMIDSRQLNQVRIVQDRGIDADRELPRDEDGTKVLSNVLEATRDTLFPLQGALGYEIQQTLFIGPNCLLVEGPSDFLILQCVSSQLEREGKQGISGKWVIIPVGGIGRVSTFAALLGSQKGMNIVALLDSDNQNPNLVKDLYKNKLLKESKIFTYAHFLDQKSADIEDLFERTFYLNLVNSEFSKQLEKPIELDELNKNEPRTVRAIQNYLKSNSSTMDSKLFNHFRPARYFAENMERLWSNLSDESKARFESIFSALNNLLDR